MLAAVLLTAGALPVTGARLLRLAGFGHLGGVAGVFARESSRCHVGLQMALLEYLSDACGAVGARLLNAVDRLNHCLVTPLRGHVAPDISGARLSAASGGGAGVWPLG